MDLEQQVMQTAKSAIAKSLHEIMTKYGSPLNKITEKVVEANSVHIEDIIHSCLTQVLSSDEIIDQVKIEFKHKVAKLLVSNASGMVEKQINKLKQDPIMKAKIIVAIEETLKSK